MSNRADTPSGGPDIKDRLATAFGSAVVMAITFVLLAIATAFFAFLKTETPTRGEFWIATFTVIALLGTMLAYALRKLGIT